MSVGARSTLTQEAQTLSGWTNRKDLVGAGVKGSYFFFFQLFKIIVFILNRFTVIVHIYGVQPDISKHVYNV